MQNPYPKREIGGERMNNIEKIIQDLIEEDRECNYCKYGSCCPRKATNYGGGPNFPPCADLAVEDWFDLDSYLENLKEEGEEE